MQQYRVNYTLLIGLLIGSVVTSGAVYGLWKFQIGRKSTVLLADAEQAIKDGDNRRAVQYYSQYLSIHPGDNEARIKFANTVTDVAHQEDRKREEFGQALQLLEATLRDLPEETALRQRLVDLYTEIGAPGYQSALSHLDMLLEKDPDNPKLHAQRASSLINSGNVEKGVDESLKIIGYDSKTDSFDEKTSSVGHDPEVYATLAVNLRSKLDKPELADRVMDQMIKVNPDNAMAYLYRGRYLNGNNDEERGKTDIEQAYKLDPDNSDVLWTLAIQAAQAKEYERSKEFIDKGKKLYPQDARFYQTAAQLEIQQGHIEAATAQIDEGLKNISGLKASNLLIFKADLQVSTGDLAGVRQTIEAMKKAIPRPEFSEWYEAQLLMAEKKWFEAQEALSRLEVPVKEIPVFASQIDVFLGLCYEQLGKYDLARDAFQRAVQQNPEDGRAKSGIQRIDAHIGPELAKTENLPESYKAWADEIAKPEAERDYGKLNEMLIAAAKDRGLDDTTLKLQQTSLALSRKDYATARKLVSEAYEAAKAAKSKPLIFAVKRTALEVTRLDPQQGPAKALAAWPKLVEEFGDLPELRIQKADMLIAINNEQLKSELAALLTGIDSWTLDQKLMLWGGMAQRYLNLGMVAEAQENLTLVADNRPTELPTRLALFNLALEANDDVGMKAAQDKILAIVKDQNDSTWLYTEARRQLSQIRRGKLDKSAVPGIRLLVDRALKQRQEWHDLYLINAELDLLTDNVAGALENYDKAEKFGRPYPVAVATHIRLLAAYGMYKQAGVLLDRIPQNVRQALLGPLYTEILFRTAQVDQAIEEARIVAEADPKNAKNLFWYGQLLARSVQDPKTDAAKRKAAMTKAIEVTRQAVAAEPEYPDAWYALINYHAMLKESEQAQQALREAQLAMNGSDLAGFLARSYEALGRWFDAETMYRAVYEVDPTNLARAQQLAEFYLGNAYAQPDRLAKATPLINQILHAGADGKLPKNDPSLLWARRVGAKILASAGEYQQLLKAENLLASNAQGDTLSLADKLEMAEILAPRPDPESRLKAAGLLEEVNQIQPLNEQAQLQLAELYYTTGNWPQCEQQMREMIGRFPNFLAARESYIRKLLTRNDQRSYSTAAAQLDKLKELAPNSKTTFELNVRLANKTGKQKEAHAFLLRSLPKIADIKQLTPEQTNSLAMFADLFVELGDLDTAEQIYRKVTELDPQKSYALASFLGLHRDPALCFDKLKEVYTSDTSAEVLGVAVSVLRARRDDVNEKFDAQINQWIDRALAENPDSIPLKLVQADFFDVKKSYDEAVDIYRKLLERQDLTGVRRAIVLNNLAFLMALADPATATDVDPLKYINEAAGILGPNSDILDTRAVIYTKQGKYDLALQDLELCVTDNPTPGKFFHKAVAHLKANQNRQAVESWEKAEKLGLKREGLNRLEFPLFDEIKGKIDELRKGSAPLTRTEPPARTGN